MIYDRGCLIAVLYTWIAGKKKICSIWKEPFWLLELLKESYYEKPFWLPKGTLLYNFNFNVLLLQNNISSRKLIT